MKGVTLAVDGSTASHTIALMRDGSLIGEARIDPPNGPTRSGRGEQLVPVIKDLLAANDIAAKYVTRMICGAGPGSFTSLRIAASVAKGIAVATGSPMYAVSSLLLTVAGIEGELPDGAYLSVLPAMRGEWFEQRVVVSDGGAIAAGPVSLICDADLEVIANATGSRLIGPGQTFEASPHARGIRRMLGTLVVAGEVAIDAWEPDYGRLAEAQVKWEASHGRPLRA